MMDKSSLNVKAEIINKLKEVIPEVFVENKLDYETLKVLLGDSVEFSNERYHLNWAGKSDAFRVLQTPTTKTLVPVKAESIDFDNTNNIFIEGENLEVLKALQKSYFGKVKMIYIDPPYNTGNDSFIYPDKFKQNKHEYEEQIDEFDDDGYRIDDSMFRKNSKDKGHYHSNWLNMMMPRLHIAKSLLRQDGVIFISIDDNEVHNLRLLCNEIFGEENCIACLSILNNLKGRSDDEFFATCNEFLLVYTKNINDAKINGFYLDEEELEKDYDISDEISAYKLINLRKTGKGWERHHRPYMYYPILMQDNKFSAISHTEYQNIYDAESKQFNDLYIDDLKSKYEREGYTFFLPLDSDGIPGRWRWGYDTFLKEKDVNMAINQNNTVCSKMRATIEDGSIRMKSAKTLWYKSEYDTGSSSKILQNIFFTKFNYFDNPKSLYFILDILKIAVNKNDIILDFFAGSGTTAHAVMELNKEDGGNRKYICVQLPEKCAEDSEAYKAGYLTIADICKERIRRVSQNIAQEITANELDLGVKVFKLQDSNFKQWRDDIQSETELLEQMEIFIDPVAENATLENMVYELLLKNGIDLNSKIVKQDGYFIVYDNDNNNNDNQQQLILILDAVQSNIIDDIIKMKPKKVIALDRIFKQDDQLKKNTALQMKDANIDFKTI